MVEILFAASALALLLAVHPYITYPLSLRIWRAMFGAVPVRPAPVAAPLTYAIVCAARNEGAVIQAKIDNLLKVVAAHPSHPSRIFVYSDGSTDNTASVLMRNAQQITPVISEAWLGKSHGMNTMLAQVDADIVVFTDANVMVDPAGLASMFNAFADPEIGCVCGHLIYENQQESAAAFVGATYWAFEERLKKLETDTGSVIGADGGLFAIRRSLWTDVPVDIIDDFHTSLSVLCVGKRVVRCENFVAFERGAVLAQEEFRRKVRIACRAFNCHRYMWPRLRRLPTGTLYKCLSHRLLRWLSGFSLIASASFFLLATVLAGYWAVALAVLLVPAALWFGRAQFLPIRRFAALHNIVLAIAGTTLGVVHSLSGRRYQTWAIAASARAAPVTSTTPREPVPEVRTSTKESA